MTHIREWAAPARRGSGRGTVPPQPALLCGLLLCSLLPWALAAPQAQAQVMEEGVISQEGTQFITEDPAQPEPPAVPPPPPPQVAPPPPPRPARAEPPPPPPQAPPRYPAVVFLLDTSDSMLNRAPGHQVTLLDQAKAALKHVIGGMSEQTRVQVWAFNTNLNKLQMPRESRSGFVRVGAPDSPVRQRLVGAIDSVRSAGGTNLYQAIVRAMELFGAREDQAAYRSGERFPVLVVVSDGEDWGKTRETLETVEQAKASHPLVTVNTIGFNVARETNWFQELCRIASRPEGCGTADDQEQLAAILESFYRAPGG